MSRLSDIRSRSDIGLLAFWSDEAGVSGGEYALLLAGIGAGVALAATSLGSAITNAVSSTSECIAAGMNCTP